ncbi:MAG TPA: hypothetical protein VEA99_09835 [Gemmatimonadaceae bacterium]|nr:hypothetical protein [Gemmatimonadaceae bacterium]
MATKTVTADQLLEILTIEVPRELESQLGRLYFDAATELHEQIVHGTPVDTGYLRASLLASADGQEPSTSHLPPTRDPNATGQGEWRRDSARGAPAYGPLAAAADAVVADGVATAVGGLVPMTIGFTAEYAKHVEDNAHMVKTARAQWPKIVERALDNARDHVRGAGGAGGAGIAGGLS